MKDYMGIGVIGCGNISGIYFENLSGERWPEVRIVACSDLDADKAKEKVDKYDGVKVMTAEELIANDDVVIVLNLTTPHGHFPLCKQAIEAGKHVYVEKPLSLKFEEGKELVAAAKAANVRIGGAPDTFLGAGIQTAVSAVKDGRVGSRVSAMAFMLCTGHESWHPDPEFYYKAGGGPMLDMGPYYVSALVSILGPVTHVSGVTKTTFAERTITSEAKNGTKITVDVPTHVTGILEFASGAVGTIITSFDAVNPELPAIGVAGTEGALTVPDPNTFGGDVLLKGKKDAAAAMEHVHEVSQNSRGLGVLDMARAIKEDRPHRANGALMCHVLEIMEKIHTASDDGGRIELETTCAGDDFPAPFTP